MKKIFLIVCFIWCSALLHADLSISPAVINITATDNAFCESVYKVFNTADTKAVVKLSVENWKNSSQNPSDVTAEKWLKLPKTEIEIAPKTEVEVPFIIETFKGMTGSVSGMVVFTSNKSSMLTMTMKVPIYVTIEGTEDVDFKIESLKINESGVGGSFYSNLTLRNDGNVHIRHTGSVKVYNTETGDVVKEIEIPESFPTYSESSRDFMVGIAEKGELKKGKYLAVFEVKALGRSVHKSVLFEAL